jgi:RNA polymerase sigma-70 factor, ECF subfamily
LFAPYTRNHDPHFAPAIQHVSLSAAGHGPGSGPRVPHARRIIHSGRLMPAEFNAPRPDLSPSSTGASGESSDGEKEQLSTARRVSTSVSTAAIDRSVLMSAGGAPPAQGLQPALLDAAYTDAEVMLRVKAGDQSAFDYLVQKYRRPLVNFMYRMARNSAVAEDLAQEVFLRVYRSRESYEASAKFTTWLYRIATNLAVNHARDTRHERPEVMVSLDEPDEDTGSTADVADSAITAEEAMVRRERLSAIRSKVEALPERQRLAVIMHKYQQMDYKRIAEVLKLSESATKSLLFRAYEALREQLKEFL